MYVCTRIEYIDVLRMSLAYTCIYINSSRPFRKGQRELEQKAPPLYLFIRREQKRERETRSIAQSWLPPATTRSWSSSWNRTWEERTSDPIKTLLYHRNISHDPSHDGRISSALRLLFSGFPSRLLSLMQFCSNFAHIFAASHHPQLVQFME